jgi:hypothetical protein
MGSPSQRDSHRIRPDTARGEGGRQAVREGDALPVLQNPADELHARTAHRMGEQPGPAGSRRRETIVVTALTCGRRARSLARQRLMS